MSQQHKEIQKFLFKKITCLLVGVLGLHCSVRAFFWLQRAGDTLRCRVRTSHCGGFSCGAQALGHGASVGLKELQPLGSRAQAQQSWYTGFMSGSMWDLPRPGLEPMFPALAGRFFTTEPLGKPKKFRHFYTQERKDKVIEELISHVPSSRKLMFQSLLSDRKTYSENVIFLVNFRSAAKVTLYFS